MVGGNIHLIIFPLGAIVGISFLLQYKILQHGNMTFEDTKHGPSQDPAFNLTLNPDKRVIILLTSFRGGSTFLGSLFDINPTVQYLFEPFHGNYLRELAAAGRVLGARPDHTDSDLRMLSLQQLLHNCTVHVTPILMERHRWCGTPEEHLARFNTVECVKKKLRYNWSQQEICRYRNTIVIKVIRLSHVEDLMKIANIKSANIKIIHLLRHPVGCLMSRLTSGKFFLWEKKTTLVQHEYWKHKISRRTKVGWEGYNYCQDQVRTINFIENNPWFKERYLRLTYDQMSLEPLKAVETVYLFSKLTLTNDIIEHVRNITGGTNIALKGSSVANVYKNSTKIAHRWLNLGSEFVTFWDIGSLEMQCKSMLGFFADSFRVDNFPRNKAFQINSDINY